MLTLRPGVTLEDLAAASWARMEHDRGAHLDVNRSTVTRATQYKVYNAYHDYLNGRGPWAPLALHPDHSWHCEPKARAVDTDDDKWIRANPQYGWRFVVATEKWHAQYYPHLDLEAWRGWPSASTETEPEPEPDPEPETEHNMLIILTTPQHGNYLVQPGYVAGIDEQLSNGIIWNNGTPNRQNWTAAQTWAISPDDLTAYIKSLSGAPFIPRIGETWVINSNGEWVKAFM